MDNQTQMILITGVIDDAQPLTILETDETTSHDYFLHLSQVIFEALEGVELKIPPSTAWVYFDIQFGGPGGLHLGDQVRITFNVLKHELITTPENAKLLFKQLPALTHQMAANARTWGKQYAGNNAAIFNAITDEFAAHKSTFEDWQTAQQKLFAGAERASKALAKLQAQNQRLYQKRLTLLEKLTEASITLDVATTWQLLTPGPFPHPPVPPTDGVIHLTLTRELIEQTFHEFRLETAEYKRLQ
ncbi:hypothetical protein ACFQ5J_00695 [Lacticaseibacillus baoqingensis]|uniref:DUF2479 domain-containing protein n=1 Tax=Lacticaseibacillus baoqingensis TaxID=2486013 RepID=A0ABW4E2H8_9LACO|nr:hypothetical protein [Lacticaseibacillus baoqingensis]